MYVYVCVDRSENCFKIICYQLLSIVPRNVPHSLAPGGGSVAGIHRSRCEDLADGGDAVAGPKGCR